MRDDLFLREQARPSRNGCEFTSRKLLKLLQFNLGAIPK
jgi:hypothetical protein